MQGLGIIALRIMYKVKKDFDVVWKCINENEINQENALKIDTNIVELHRLILRIPIYCRKELPKIFTELRDMGDVLYKKKKSHVDDIVACMLQITLNKMIVFLNNQR